jgi:hypothetical protein
MKVKQELEAYLSDLKKAYQEELDGPCEKHGWLSDEAMRYQGRIGSVEYILNRLELWGGQ